MDASEQCEIAKSKSHTPEKVLELPVGTDTAGEKQKTIEEVSVASNGNQSTPAKSRKRKRKMPELQDLPDHDTRVKKAKRPGFTAGFETQPYYENGFRKIYPYFFTHTAFCRGRWVGKSLLDMFEEEFRRYSREYYETQIKNGRILVNYKPAVADQVLKNNDIISNTIHRHESPVLDTAVKIIVDDKHMIVVDKPPSIPIHPCGAYRHNSLTRILKETCGQDLNVIHRLDRLTSGLVLFAKDSETARSLEEEIRNRQVEKEYLCIVHGSFPEEEVKCDERLSVISHKLGICGVSPDGKESSTVFQRIRLLPDDRSLVSCRPKTGRMHQIRVHLQYLGYPIVQDPVYNSAAFGPNKGKHGDYGKTIEELVKELTELHDRDQYIVPDQPTRKPIRTAPSRGTQTDDAENETPEKNCFDTNFTTYDPDCRECHVEYREPTPAECFMYLHALRYRGDGWSYQTEWPAWAKK